MTHKSSSDGRFLRGQKWERYSIQKTQADFYISSDGNDSWSGTLPSPNKNETDGPFATIKRAQEAVLALKRQVYSKKKLPMEKRFVGSPHKYGTGKDILILIREGYYHLEKPIVFNSNDGGERVETDVPTGAFEFRKLKDYFVTYAAYPGETPIISGGKKITHWKQNGIKWEANAKGLEVKRLLTNGKVQTLARTPNNGYFTPTGIPESTTEFEFREGDLKKWKNIKGNRIIMLLRWHTGINSIKNIDTEKNILHLDKSQPGIVVVPPRYYIENVEELLDSHGEWFFNTDTEKLCYIPDQNIENPNDANIVTPILSQLIKIEGQPKKPVRNLRFYGLNFEATNPENNAISFTYASNCEFVDSKIKGLGNIAIKLSKGCYLNKIINNTIKDVDEGGIFISGDPQPDWVDLIHENTISYNYLSNCGGTSIHVSNTRDTTISHNEITKTRGRTPLQVGGWSNVEEAIEGGYRVEYNYIHHVQEGSDDSGAITTNGLTTDSIIRYNLIHDVNPGFFNENVAFWYDNMSSGWTVVDNIYYNLKQAEMKLCACLLSDNIYKDNFFIETPENEYESKIGKISSTLEYKHLKIEKEENSIQSDFVTGQILKASTEVTNSGTTGIANVFLYIDGKVSESKKFPLIQNNTRTITFNVIFHNPGKHTVAIGTTAYKTLNIVGKSLHFLFNDLKISAPAIPEGEEVIASAIVENITDSENTTNVNLYMNDSIIDSRLVTLLPGKSEQIFFNTKPKKGIYKIRIGNSSFTTLEVYPHSSVNIAKSEFNTHCSGTARPCEFNMDKTKTHYTIKAGGTDFLHAEDSYGAIYLKDAIKGNFVATLKVKAFSKNPNPWYRAGIYFRNDISKSHETEPGSLGSVLLYATPKLTGIQWDEFGDGCMHKGGDRDVYKTDNPFPIWLKLVKHGNTFTGYTSYDGVNWVEPKYTTSVPGLADTMDIGIAASTIDQIPDLVDLGDFTLEVENEDWQ